MVCIFLKNEQMVDMILKKIFYMYIEIMRRNPYHLVEFSPWPLTGSIGALFLTLGLVGWFHLGIYRLLLTGLFLIIFTIIQ